MCCEPQGDVLVRVSCMLPRIVRDEDTGEMVEARCGTLIARIVFHTDMAPAKSVLQFTRDKVDCPSDHLAGADFSADLVILDPDAESLGAHAARNTGARKPPTLEALNLRDYGALVAGMKLTSSHLRATLNYENLMVLIKEEFDPEAASAALLIAGATGGIGQARVWLRNGLLHEISMFKRGAAPRHEFSDDDADVPDTVISIGGSPSPRRRPGERARSGTRTSQGGSGSGSGSGSGGGAVAPTPLKESPMGREYRARSGTEFGSPVSEVRARVDAEGVHTCLSRA